MLTPVKSARNQLQAAGAGSAERAPTRASTGTPSSAAASEASMGPMTRKWPILRVLSKGLPPASIRRARAAPRPRARVLPRLRPRAAPGWSPASSEAHRSAARTVPRAGRPMRKIAENPTPAAGQTGATAPGSGARVWANCAAAR